MIGRCMKLTTNAPDYWQTHRDPELYSMYYGAFAAFGKLSPNIDELKQTNEQTNEWMDGCYQKYYLPAMRFIINTWQNNTVLHNHTKSVKHTEKNNYFIPKKNGVSLSLDPRSTTFSGPSGYVTFSPEWLICILPTNLYRSARGCWHSIVA